MKGFIFILNFIFLSLIIHAQEIKIYGNLNHILSYDSIHLAENIGGKYSIIQSSAINKQGDFSFSGNYPTGYYAIWLGETNFAQIILNKENLSIKFQDTILRNDIEILGSIENSMLWDFIYNRKKYKSEISQAYMHKTEFAEYSANYQYFDSIEKSLITKYHHYILTIDSLCPDSFLSKSILADIEPKKNESFFKYVDFSNPNLIRSGVFTKKIIDFLQYETEYTEQGFVQSIDTILELSSQNNLVYDFVLNHLLEIFNEVGPDVILNYLIEEYVIGEACTDLDLSQVLNNKLAAYKKLSIGNRAPNISAFDINGIMKNLHDICSFYDLNILYFGSKQCNFCQESTPQLISYLDQIRNKMKIQLIYYSLDQDINEWLYTNENKPDYWVSISELKGWNSKSTHIFQIHKTPSFYLLDKNSMIISKPKTIDELLKELSFIMQKKRPDKNRVF